MDHPIICFGQQPSGFFPKRFLFAKIVTARRLQMEIGGEIVFFFPASNHDPRDANTILADPHSNRRIALNFQFQNRIKKKLFPLYAKTVLPEQISPTRDTRFVWMQSVIRCTHYVAGASEQDYVNKADAPEVKFVRRDEISDSGKSYTEQ